MYSTDLINDLNKIKQILKDISPKDNVLIDDLIEQKLDLILYVIGGIVARLYFEDNMDYETYKELTNILDNADNPAKNFAVLPPSYCPAYEEWNMVYLINILISVLSIAVSVEYLGNSKLVFVIVGFLSLNIVYSLFKLIIKEE